MRVTLKITPFKDEFPDRGGSGGKRPIPERPHSEAVRKDRSTTHKWSYDQDFRPPFHDPARLSPCGNGDNCPLERLYKANSFYEKAEEKAHYFFLSYRGA